MDVLFWDGIEIDYSCLLVVMYVLIPIGGSTSQRPSYGAMFVLNSKADSPTPSRPYPDTITVNLYTLFA